MCYYFWGIRSPERDPEEIVSIEAMGLSWRLPWRVVKEDVESGLATLIESVEAQAVREQGIGE